MRKKWLLVVLFILITLAGAVSLYLESARIAMYRWYNSEDLMYSVSGMLSKVPDTLEGLPCSLPFNRKGADKKISCFADKSWMTDKEVMKIQKEACGGYFGNIEGCYVLIVNDVFFEAGITLKELEKKVMNYCEYKNSLNQPPPLSCLQKQAGNLKISNIKSNNATILTYRIDWE